MKSVSRKKVRSYQILLSTWELTIEFDNVETIDNLGNHGFGGQGVKMSLKLIRKILKKQTLSIEQLIKEFFRERL